MYARSEYFSMGVYTCTCVCVCVYIGVCTCVRAHVYRAKLATVRGPRKYEIYSRAESKYFEE